MPLTQQRIRTEPEVIELLRRKHAKVGNGGAGEYAFLTHVRNAAGFDATRTLDALTLSLWPSRGMELHGYEIKCSRADWLREKADPSKAETFIRRLDRFSLVVTDATYVAEGELPPDWGLISVRGNKLHTDIAAPKLLRTDDERTIGRTWLVCLLRAAGEAVIPKPIPSEEVAIVRAREEGWSQAMDRVKEQRAKDRAAIKAEEEIRHEIYRALHMNEPYAWSTDVLAELRKIARAVRMVVTAGDVEEAARVRLRGLAAQALALGQQLEAAATR